MDSNEPDSTLPGLSPALTYTERQEHDAARLFNEPLLTASERKAERKRAYVELIGSGCNHSEAAEGVGVDRATAFRWRQEDPEFAQACRTALRASIDVLKAEAERRALKGSDKLLMFLLCNYAPEQFSDKQKVEHSGGVSLQVVTGVPQPGEDLA